AGAERWANLILQNGPMSIRASKQAMHRGLGVSLEQALAEQFDYPAVKALAASEDYVEGPKAFAEKRPPQWKGR
ncbi:enoyl-CoA hydratase-related protein, partial [Acinetobacter baumannii]